MRLSARVDLGGYAAAKGPRDVEVTRPFVLLCGANGSGKTATLRMMRAALGLEGERAGTVSRAFGPPRIDPGEAGGDLGKSAAFRSRHGRAPCLEDGAPGVLDVRALGWAGQRTWLFDSRAETARLGRGTLGDDVVGQVAAIFAAKGASHGQYMRGPWAEALAWAIGEAEAPDPYDDPARLPPGLRAVWRELVGDAPRAAERWLLLDEPEAAIDADALVAGMAVLLGRAAEGRLRVFCASHSPAFAAGLADHPAVQAVDMGGAPVPWLEAERTLLAIAASPARLAKVGAALERDLRADGRRRRASAAAAARDDTAKVVRELDERCRDLLLSCQAAPDGAARTDARGESDVHCANLRSGRGGDLLRWDGATGSAVLTPYGSVVARLLRKRIDARATRVRS